MIALESNALPLNLEHYLKLEMQEGKTDFRLRARLTEDGHVVFYVHPADASGLTLEFTARKNVLTTIYHRAPKTLGQD
jgi:hypothetical protein